jgi:tetratricopeptide (TPR) repeat protein
VALPHFACAQTPTTPQPAAEQQISYTEAAAILIQAGRLDDAKRVLVLALQQTPNNNEAVFLRGMIAATEKNFDQAIVDFRFILASEPARERVRLELARAFFLLGDYDNAERNFRFARAGDLPDEVKTNIDQYLAAILRLKRWSYDFGLALADDTNVNGATNVHQVDLYGLPFTLSDNARQKSGAGVAIDFGGEFSPQLSESWKGAFGGHIHRAEYGAAAFDDMTVSAYAGPRYLIARWRFDTLATAFRRWYGNVPYNEGIGGRASVGFALFPAVQLGVTFDAQSVFYRSIEDQNGPIYATNGELVYTFGPSRLVRFSGGVAAQEARSNVFASTTRWLAFDYYQDLPFGFSAGVEPAYSWTGYDAPQAAFGATRSDHTWAVRLDLLNRRLEFRGFAPRISFIHVSQRSNIALYRYSRDQIQLGFTRQF